MKKEERLGLQNFNESEIVHALSSSGKNKNPDDFNCLQEYLTKYNERPSTYTINDKDTDYYDMNDVSKSINKDFKKNKILFEDKYYNIAFKKERRRRQTILLQDGYILDLCIEIASNSFHDIISVVKDKYTELIEYNVLLMPNKDNELYDKTVTEKLIKSFSKNRIIYEESKVSIGMVSIDQEELYVEDFQIEDKIEEMLFPDMHYGEGFMEWYKELLNRLRNDTKGLVLLHGKTGTGKTFFVRQLLKELSKTDKNILYFSPTMVDSITDPSLINFISVWANGNDKKGILLIEDAEPLLEDRGTGRNIGITNLLNLTDGLLNDVLGIQIICTFNTELANIDSALLREERLIARKEFRPLSKEKAAELAEKLGVNKDNIVDDMTLADFYACKKEKKTIIHDVNNGRSKIGFRSN